MSKNIEHQNSTNENHYQQLVEYLYLADSGYKHH